MRALSLNPNELENIPQRLNGGDYIDLLGMVDIGNQQREIRTILRGVLVLSVQKNENKTPESLTIALHPTQVEILLNTTGKKRLVVTEKPADNSRGDNMGSIEVIRGIQRERKVT